MTPSPDTQRSAPWRRIGLAALFSGLMATGLAGCATQEKWIERRPADSSLISPISWLGDEDPVVSQATLAVAQPRGLDPADSAGRQQLMTLLEQEAHTTLSAELEFALSELAAHEADEIAPDDQDQAVGYYAESLIHGYRAVTGDPYQRTPGTTGRYNQSLEALLRVLQSRNQVRPGAMIRLPLTHSACSIAVELHSRRWTEADFQGFEFAEDFQVTGLRNHYHKTGVGVPLIAIRHHTDRDHPEDKFYPRKLCYPLTAFVRAEETTAVDATGAKTPGPTRLVLELHDPMDHETLDLAGRPTPLESDLTTPLAYYLDQPDLHEDEVSTLGLLQPDRVKQLQGLYLLEPFDPNRIPVVMVHGLWSSPATWMEMFNDLRSDPQIRSRYQFWFYLYPTGSPFWVSAAQMRADLAELRQSFDPQHKLRPLDQTVLVGHSMGGLLCRLQTVDSGQNFWQIVSERRLEDLDADPETREYLSNLFYFQPNNSVRHVVTIGSPHRGSRYVNGFTQWLGARLIAVPMQTMAKRQELFRRNPGFFRPRIATRVMTSIDSLSPDSPMLSTLLTATPAPWVDYHNVVGDAPRNGLSGWLSTRGDGVVSLESARLDDLPRLASQIVVPEEHVTLHRHPQSVEEVRRVLLKQLAELSPQGPRPLGPRPPIVRPVVGAGATPPAPPVVRLVSGVSS